MRLRFFTVPAQSPEPAQDELNAFCAQHRVVTVEKQFVAHGGASFWAICVSFIDGDAGRTNIAGKRERVDYKEVLNEADFAVFAELRSLRKAIAEREGIPAYALFTNEQLAEMVTKRVVTHAALDGIDGVGKARVEKYSAAFLPVLRKAFDEKTDETNPHHPG